MRSTLKFKKITFIIILSIIITGCFLEGIDNAETTAPPINQEQTVDAVVGWYCTEQLRRHR